VLAELRRRLASVRQRAYRLERREARQFRKWIETTSNLTQVPVLLFVPLLVDVVADEDVAAAERTAVADTDQTSPGNAENAESEAATEAEKQVADASARELERHADAIEQRLGVPCDVVVAVADGDPADTVLVTAEETNSDLVVTPFEANGDGLSPFVRSLFHSDTDVVAFRSAGERTRWKRIMVPVRSASDVAHAMVDYAERLVGRTGSISVCSCIDVERDRRSTESMLANLTETVDATCETRVSRSSIESFLKRNDLHYDVVFLGASTDRSAASRFVSRPTFERVQDLETDIAIVHLG
jgi:nucleotide-binding universal stress UspA family protein